MIFTDDVRQLSVKKPGFNQSEPLEQETQHDAGRFYSIDGAHLEIHAGCFRKIASLNRNLRNSKPHINRLRNHLGIKNEVVGIQQKRHRREEARGCKREIRCGNR